MCIQASVQSTLTLLLLMSFCATVATGATCEEIPFEICTALPYTLTGFPNSLGHASADLVPASLSGAFRTLIVLGCYDHVQLFLCAAAFPQCTTSGSLLPPCRSLCETAVSKCGFWFSFYSDLISVNCQLMPNSSNSNVCIGLDTSPSPLQSEPFSENASPALLETTEGIEIMPNVQVTRENPLPWQPVTETVDETGSVKREAEKENRTGRNTVFDLHASSPEFTSQVIVQRSTDEKGVHRITDTVDRSVKTNNIKGDTSHLNVPSVLGITLSVLSCGGMVIVLISCAFFRKVIGKPFSAGSRTPRDGAFYTNPAFSDISQSSQGTNTRGQSLGTDQHAFTLEDLPPHPASVDVRPRRLIQTQPNIYQQEPAGFIEQNLFAVPLSPSDHHGEAHHERRPASHTGHTPQTGHAPKGPAETHGTVPDDFVFSNNATNASVDTNANEQRAASSDNKSALAPSTDKPFPTVSTNMDDADMVIANPVAC